jgi:amidase
MQAFTIVELQRRMDVGELTAGISFFAGAWSEPVLLRLAYAFEQATQARRAPSFLPTAHLAGEGR